MESGTYFEETIFNAIVIASRVVEDKNKAEILLKMALGMVELTVQAERSDVGLNITKAMIRMCERFNLDVLEVSYWLGICHFKWVREHGLNPSC